MFGFDLPILTYNLRLWNVAGSGEARFRLQEDMNSSVSLAENWQMEEVEDNALWESATGDQCEGKNSEKVR